ARDAVPEWLPLQQFNRDEASPTGLVDLIDRADVRVVQRGCGFGFSLETAESLYVLGEFVGQKLQGDVAAESQVLGFIYDAHAPAANFAKDAVVGNRLTHGLGRSGHWQVMLGSDGGQVNESHGVDSASSCGCREKIVFIRLIQRLCLHDSSSSRLNSSHLGISY